MKDIFILLFYLAALVGEVTCVVRFFKCDFEPSYKAEIIYGVSMATGLGCVVGYIDFGK